MATFSGAAVDVAITNSPAVAAESTVALWFRSTWAHTDGAQHYFFSQFNDANNFFTLLKHTDNSLYLGFKSAGTDDRKVVTSGNYAIVSGVDYHLAVTSSQVGAVTTAYLNGVQLGPSQEMLGTVPSLTGIRYIGNVDTDGDGTTQVDFAGSIEHFAQWSRVLSASEIAGLAARGNPKSLSPVTYVSLFAGALKDTGSSPATVTNHGTTPSFNVDLGGGGSRSRGRGRSR